MKQTSIVKTLAVTFILVFSLGGAARADTLSDLNDSISNLGESLKELPGKAQNLMPRPNFVQLAKDAGPAVVNVSIERTTTVRQPSMPIPPEFFRGSPFGDDFMDEFFGGPRSAPRERRQSSMGSGFLISGDGYLVTNNHVVDGADVIKVKIRGKNGKVEETYDAEVVGADRETDLALLKIKADHELPHIEFGDSDALEVGEWVVAIGNPFGLDNTVTAGILSAKLRNIGSNTLVRFLQTDASINPGNSGGPLLNMDGQVIGINTAIAANGQGIGFAIPSSLAKEIIDDLKADRKVSRGWLGVSIQNVDEATAKALSLPKAAGALIGGVMPDQPADKAGLEAGDVILTVDKSEIADADELMRTIAAMKPGAAVNVEVWRDGKKQTKKVVLSERGGGQDEPDKKPEVKPQENLNPLGLQIRALNEQEFSRLRLDPKQGGVLITQVEPDKPGAKSGLRRGDVVLAVGRNSVKGADEFDRTVNDMSTKQGAVMLQVYRNGQRFILSVDTAAASGGK
ncbi:MAG: Do family serine endopeptidase [Deltaproteobacteria bacterium]|jgi:serine protease Do|nr:Do family serine endopeptidase [Deltaproteobacteria bacterium]